MQGMKNTYFCKCGRIVRKSTDADNTGNRDVKGCTGCPYLLPWGKQAHSPEKGWYLEVKGYECRVSQNLEYASRFCGNVDDKCSCYVASLDYEFLAQIIAWIHETYPDGEIVGNFTPKNIRPTDFSSNGRYREPLYCAQNKTGMAAKAALLERFFNPDGSRKDMTPEEEERKIKDLIENGKRAAQGGSAEPEQTPALPEEKRDILAAENQIFVDPNGVKYRIGIEKGFGKKTYWRTERMDNGEWIPNNSSSYPKFENAQGEFAACIRIHSLVPMEPENEDPAVTAALSAAPMAADTSDTSDTTEALTTVANTLPAFDYSGLDAEARDTLHVAETMIKSARQKFISEVADAVALAHDALCGTVVRNSDNGKYAKKDDTFFAWCASVGLSRSTAYQLLQVSTLFKGSTPVERQVLEQAQPSLLYAAAKPSAPAEAVAAVKSGDITTYKAYQELMEQLMAEQNARKAAEAENRANSALLAEEQRRQEKVQQMAIEAGKKREKAEEKAKEALQGKQAAELERDSVRSMLKNTQRRAERLEIEHNDTVAHLESIRAELNALRARPIEVAVADPDPAEIERLANEKAEGIAAQRTAELKAQVDKLQQEAQENRTQNAEDLKMQDYDTVLFAISVIQNAWKSAGPSFRRLDDQCRAQLRRNLMERIAEIEKAVNVC